MSELKSITIVGGGLAGLTLGIGLRQRGVPVTVFEASHYPRHRVCGEFISGRGLETLARLGLRERLLDAGARPAVTAGFFTAQTISPPRELPVAALCVSRHTLDDLLAKEFERLGGELREGSAWRGGESLEGVVHATGRRARPVDGGWRWFGLKAHARNVGLSADLEMHLTRNGYVGICKLANGEVNVCGLFRRRVGENHGDYGWRKALRGTPGSPLNQRMASAEFDENSFCSVAGLSLAPRRASEQTVCCVGDTLTMTPPVTGNGMSMAFESAELAIAPMAAFSAGECSWTDARQCIARSCDDAFARRLRWANWLHRLMFVAPLQNAFLRFGPHCFWTAMVVKTR